MGRSVGRPVITTFLAGIPELVDGDCGWLVPMGDPSKLADAMQAALEIPAERLTEMGLVGRARVRAEHRAVTEAQKLSGLFLGAMGRDAEAEAFAASLRLGDTDGADGAPERGQQTADAPVPAGSPA